MNKFAKHTPVALFVGLQACVIQIIDNYLHLGMPLDNVGLSWVSFLGWATYFMAGCTPRDGVRCFAGFIVGIVAGIAIFLIGGVFGALGSFAFPAAIIIIATILFYFELFPFPVDFVPSFYISCGTFFGLMNYVEGATFGTVFATEMIYLTLGLIFGWMTIAFRTWLGGKLGDTTEEA